jgi:PAS domain S-box-containing protein
MNALRPLRVLILEDQPTDADLILDELRQAGFDPDWRCVQTQADYRANLHDALELILADFSLPQYDALHALYELQQQGLDIPFIVVTGTISEESAVECMKQGAADYLLKDRLTRLGPAVTQALQAKKLRDDKRRAVDALEQERNLLRTVIDHIPDYVYVKDTESRFVNANARAVADLVGHASLDKVIGKTDFEFFPEEAAAIFFADEQEVFRSGQALINKEEQTIDHRTGQTRWVLTTKVPVRDAQGQITGLVGIGHDITERKLVEEALRESEERFSKAFHASPTGILITRLEDGHILDANDSFCRLTGYSRAEVIGRLVPDLKIWPTPSGRFQALAQLREHQPIRDAEEEFYTKTGETRLALVSAELIEIGGEECVLVLFYDITDRKRAQAELMNAEVLRVELEKEKELLELKERFIATISHDFRTPLTVIRSSSDLLDQFYDRIPPEKRLRHLQEIQTQINVMIEMLDDVLVINKAQAGKLTPAPAPLDVVEFCRALFDELQLTDMTGHEFVFSAEGHFERVALDKKLLRHILVNLLSNAIKYAPGGGVVRLELVGAEDQVIFHISDQGIGIPEADQARLFEAFHRARNSTHIPGTGLGLAIVKSSVGAHKGSITFESREGSGTTFTVSLPARLDLD